MTRILRLSGKVFSRGSSYAPASVYGIILPMKKSNDYSGFIIAFAFFALIISSLVLFNREREKESVAENRMLSQFPKIEDLNPMSVSEYRKELSAWFEDNLGLRDQYLTLSGILKYNLLHRAKTSKVEIGRDCFLYLADEGNLELETSKSAEFMEKLPEYAKVQQEISDKLKLQGIDYVFMIAPGKPAIYPENISSSDHVVTDTIGDAMYDYLTDNTNVHAYWPKDILLEAKDNEAGEALYLKTDTHWTTYGRNIAYRDLIDTMNSWGFTDAKPADVRFYESEDPYIGDLSNMMGPVTWTGKWLEEEDFLDWEVAAPKARVIDQGEEYDRFHEMLLRKNVYNPDLCAIFHNDVVPGKKVLICGDSMVGVCILPELAECFSDMTFIWSYSIDQDFIDFVQPDIVISEFGERELKLRLDAIKGF